MSVEKYSTNKRAGELLGYRTNGISIDAPCELGYHCPVCKYELETNGSFDERLTWSEYNDFLWCSVCDKDYPSCLCIPDIDKAVVIFLLTIEDVTNRLLCKMLPKNAG